MWLGTFNANIDAPGTHMAVQVDPDGNGIKSPAVWTEGDALQYLGDLSGDTCGGANDSGAGSAIAMGMDKSASVLAGLAYADWDGDGNCQGDGELVPFVWDAGGGMRTLYNVSTVTTFPDGLRSEIAGGALFGRCEFID